MAAVLLDRRDQIKIMRGNEDSEEVNPSDYLRSLGFTFARIHLEILVERLVHFFSF